MQTRQHSWMRSITGNITCRIPHQLHSCHPVKSQGSWHLGTAKLEGSRPACTRWGPKFYLYC